MIIRQIDKKYRFYSVFNTDTGAYMRSGVIDKDGKETKEDAEQFLDSMTAIRGKHAEVAMSLRAKVEEAKKKTGISRLG